jgi:hypothetical protein
MKRLRKWGMVAIVLAGAALLTRVVISQQTAGAPPLPDAYVELFQQARPHLEAVLGRQLAALPKFSTALPQQLLRVADPDLDAHLRWHFAHLQGEPLKATREVARQVIASATIAQYAEGYDVIVVVPDNVEKIAAWDEALAQAKTQAFVQLVLVHEAVRCHLDHCYGLASLRGACKDAEEYHALHAVIEGYAQYVTRQVAARLGSQALFPLLAEHYLHVPDECADPAIRAASQTALQTRNFACVKGLAFFAGLESVGLKDIEATVFKRLPQQMATINRPDHYVHALQANRPSLASVLQPLETTFPQSDWVAVQQTWTPAMLTHVAGLLGTPRERVDKVAATWDEGRTLVWAERNHPGRQIALTVVRHESPAGARSYFGLALDLQRKQDTAPPGTCGPALQVLQSKSTDLQLEGFDEVVRNDKEMQIGTGQALPVSQVMGRAGDLVVECIWHGSTIDADLAAKLLQTVRQTAR